MAASSEVSECSEEKKSTDDTELNVNSAENNKVKLEDLKVSDLKYELSKRDMDKSGVKSVLIERLKEAIIEENKNPEEYKFEISSDSSVAKSSLEELIEVSDTNGSIPTNDEINNSEEKQEIALQLSLDEEEAQLNEESLIEVTKPPDDESSKVESTEQVSSIFCTSEKNVVSDKQSTPVKLSKALSEEVKEKKIVKPSISNKISEGTSSVSPKVLKVIGKSDKLKSSSILAKSLWITGLPNTTRAADLKTLFSKQGRVLSVKIVKSAKQTPAKCYGIVTMTTSKDATKAIQNLHRTELNGKIISVERKSGETATMLKKSEAKVLSSTAKKAPTKKEISVQKAITHEKDSALKSRESAKVDSKGNEKKTISEDSDKKNIEKSVSSEKSKDKEKSKTRENRERVTHRIARKSINYRVRQPGYNDKPRFESFRRPFVKRPFNNRFGFNSSFRPRSSLMDLQKIREERFQRERFRERREAERRREDELTRHRYIERKQREEAYRLEREKEKLRLERELLERERAEIIKLEREKQRLERERLEHEREELRRQAELGRSAKRPFSRVDRSHEPVWADRKKSTSRYDIRPSFRGEASSSSRFEFSSRERANFTREYDRHPDKYSSSKHLEVLPRSEFVNRSARREIAVRARDERQIFNRGDFRENRRSLSSRDPDRHSSTRREPAKSEWKHDRRKVQERVIPSNSSSGQRRMTYY